MPAASVTIDSKLVLVIAADAEFSAIEDDAVSRRALALLGRPDARFEERQFDDGESLGASLALSIILAARAPQRVPISLSVGRAGRTYRLKTRDLGDQAFRFDRDGILRAARFSQPGPNARLQRGIGRFSYGSVVVSRPPAEEVVDSNDFHRARVAADLRRELRQAILNGPIPARPGAGAGPSRRILQRRAAGAVAYFNAANPGFDARWWIQGKLVLVAATNPYTSETVTLVLRLRGQRIDVADG